MKTICATFSHERYAGLVNAVASIKRHFPMMDILVVDDGSSDTRIAAWCEDQLSKGTLVHFHVRTGSKPRDGRVGGLHENMQYALDWALARDYDMMLTMQDDLQCLWGGQEILNEVAGFFQNCEDALFLQNRFRLRTNNYANGYLYYDEELDAYRLNRACNDVGFFSIARIYEAGFCFGRNEFDSAEIARKLGFHGYQMAAPIVADIPLVAANRLEFLMRRANLDIGNTPSENPSALRDLTLEDIAHLKARNRKVQPFAEDYVRRSDGKDTLFPHCFRNDPDRYAKTSKLAYKLEKRSFKLGKGLFIHIPVKTAYNAKSSEREVMRTGNGVPVKFWQTAMERSHFIRHNRYISPINTISEYIFRKIGVLLFYYLEYPRIRRWFLDSSRKPEAG